METDVWRFDHVTAQNETRVDDLHSNLETCAPFPSPSETRCTPMRKWPETAPSCRVRIEDAECSVLRRAAPQSRPFRADCQKSDAACICAGTEWEGKTVNLARTQAELSLHHQHPATSDHECNTRHRESVRRLTRTVFARWRPRSSDARDGTLRE